MKHMFAAILAAFALMATPAMAYTGQIMTASDGTRYERILIRKGDSVWGLCMVRDWCRAYYPENSLTSREKNWGNFLTAVAKLNDGKKIGLLFPGQYINFPVSIGAAAEFASLDQKVAAQAKEIGEQKTTIQTLVDKIDTLLLRISGPFGLETQNKELKQANETLLSDNNSLRSEVKSISDRNLLFGGLALLAGLLLAVAVMQLLAKRREVYTLPAQRAEATES